MGITHIVLFRFQPTISVSSIQEVSQHFLSLKDKCIDPKTKKPYILSLKGGVDNSPEGINNGMTYGYVVEFENAQDRDYYVNEDPAHDEFKKVVGKHLEKAQVLDFEDGIFS